MPEEPLAQQLIALQRLLSEVDSRLMKAPVTPTGLADLKGSVDSLRTNIWAIMSAGKGALSATTVRRFRLRRNAEMLKDLANELEASPEAPRDPEHEELAEAARRIVSLLDNQPSRT